MVATASELSIKLNHPAYDCFYLALAIIEDCRMVTADNRFLRVLGQSPHGSLLEYCAPLADFA